MRISSKAPVLGVLALCCTFFAFQSFGQSFTNANLAAGIDHQFAATNLMGGGLAWFDYDNDGWEDVYVTGGHNADALYHNNSDGTFTNLIFEAGFIETSDKNTIGVSTGDIDNDGFREVFISTQNAGFGLAHQPNFLFYNNGDGTFSDITESAGLTEAKWAHSSTWLDANLDGLLDLFVGNYIETSVVLYDEFNNPAGFAHECYLDDLYINNGDLTFTNATETYNALNDGCTLAMASTDFNRDRHTDLVIANDFGEWVTPNMLLVNDTLEEAFINVSALTGMDLPIYGMGVAVGDFDEDLDLDYYFTNLGANSLMVQEDGVFSDEAEARGVLNEEYGNGKAVGWGTFFFDYDNDTYLDLYVSNGYIPAIPWLTNMAQQNNSLFKGGEDGVFTEVNNEAIPDNMYRSRGCAYADFNKDGALDFAVMSIHSQFNTASDELVLYQNTPSDNNYVSFDLEGLVCNRDAFGTQVELHAGGRTFLQEISGGSSYCSQNSSILHFGLGEIEFIDSLNIFWPIGPVQHVDSLDINMVHQILQDTTVVVPPPPDDTTTTSVWEFHQKLFRIYPNPAEDYLTCPYTHLRAHET